MNYPSIIHYLYRNVNSDKRVKYCIYDDKDAVNPYKIRTIVYFSIFFVFIQNLKTNPLNQLSETVEPRGRCFFSRKRHRLVKRVSLKKRIHFMVREKE